MRNEPRPHNQRGYPAGRRPPRRTCPGSAASHDSHSPLVRRVRADVERIHHFNLAGIVASLRLPACLAKRLKISKRRVRTTSAGHDVVEMQRTITSAASKAPFAVEATDKIAHLLRRILSAGSGQGDAVVILEVIGLYVHVVTIPRT